MKAREREGSGERERGSRAEESTAGENIKTPILSVSLIENISVKNNVSERLCEKFLSQTNLSQNSRVLDIFIEVLLGEPQSIAL